MSTGATSPALAIELDYGDSANTAPVPPTNIDPSRPRNSVWWTFIAPVDGQARVDTIPMAAIYGDDADTMVSVYTSQADAEARSNPICAEDDAWFRDDYVTDARWLITAGTTYWVQVGTFSVNPAPLTEYTVSLNVYEYVTDWVEISPLGAGTEVPGDITMNGAQPWHIDNNPATNTLHRRDSSMSGAAPLANFVWGAIFPNVIAVDPFLRVRSWSDPDNPNGTDYFINTFLYRTVANTSIIGGNLEHCFNTVSADNTVDMWGFQDPDEQNHQMSLVTQQLEQTDPDNTPFIRLSLVPGLAPTGAQEAFYTVEEVGLSVRYGTPYTPVPPEPLEPCEDCGGEQWLIEACDLRTGIVRAVLEPTQASWQTILDRFGRGQMVLPTKAVSVRNIFPHLVSVYISRTSGGSATPENPYCEGAFIIEEFDAGDDGTTQVGMLSIDNYLYRRNIRTDKNYDNDPQTEIAVSLASLATPNGIPLTFAAEPSVYFRDRSYAGVERKPIGEALEELADVLDGIDWELEHTKTGGAWSTRIIFRDNVGASRDLILQSDREASGYGLRVDGSNHATLVDAIGADIEDSDPAVPLIATAQDDPPFFPQYDAAPAFRDITQLSTLQSSADGALAANRDPVATPAVTIPGLDGPDPDLVRNGDIVTVRTNFGAVTYDGRARVISTSWSIAEGAPVTRTYEFAPLTPSSQAVLGQTPTDECQDCPEFLPVPPVILSPTEGEEVLDATPTISGSGVPGATITVSIDGDLIGDTVVDTEGAWAVTPTDPLSLGEHTATATQLTLDGYESEADPVTFNHVPGPLPDLLVVGTAFLTNTSNTAPTITLPAGTQATDTVVIGVSTRNSNTTPITGTGAVSDARFTSVAHGVWIGQAGDLSPVGLINPNGDRRTVVLAVFRSTVPIEPFTDDSTGPSLGTLNTFPAADVVAATTVLVVLGDCRNGSSNTINSVPAGYTTAVQVSNTSVCIGGIYYQTGSSPSPVGNITYTIQVQSNMYSTAIGLQEGA